MAIMQTIHMVYWTLSFWTCQLYSVEQKKVNGIVVYENILWLITGGYSFNNSSCHIIQGYGATTVIKRWTGTKVHFNHRAVVDYKVKTKISEMSCCIRMTLSVITSYFLLLLTKTKTENWESYVFWNISDCTDLRYHFASVRSFWRCLKLFILILGWLQIWRSCSSN